MINKNEAQKIKNFGFQECEFLSDGEDCVRCQINEKDERIWFEGGTYENPDEGDYYCDKCAIEFINNIESFLKKFAEDYENSKLE